MSYQPLDSDSDVDDQFPTPSSTPAVPPVSRHVQFQALSSRYGTFSSIDGTSRVSPAPLSLYTPLVPVPVPFPSLSDPPGALVRDVDHIRRRVTSDKHI